MAKKRLPLSIQITSLFLVLSVAIGTALIAISYSHSQSLIEQSAKKISKENSQRLESSFQKNISPILTTLDLMATSSLPKLPPQGGRLSIWTDSIKLIFQRNPSLTGLFYGSEDGSFTQFRPITPVLTETFATPPGTDVMLNYYLAEKQNTFHFLGEELHQVENRDLNQNLYDPRTRPWYMNAAPDGKIVLSEPYEFFFIKRVGVTLSRLSTDGETVVAADFTLRSLSEQLQDLEVSGKTRLAIFDQDFNLIAQRNLLKDENAINTLQKIELKNTVFEGLDQRFVAQSSLNKVKFAGQQWFVTLSPVRLTDKIRVYLAEATPGDELLDELIEMRNEQIITAVIMIVLSFSLVWFAALRITRPLNNLSELTKNVHSFNFRKVRYPKSVIAEVNTLTHSIQLMEHTIHDLLKLLRETASKHDFHSLAKTVCQQSYTVTKAETIVLHIKESGSQRFEVITNHAIIPLKIDVNDLMDNTPWMRSRLSEGEVISLTRKDNCLSPYIDYFYNSDLHLFPLLNREQELIGVLAIGYEREDDESRTDKHAFLKELLGFVEIAKENIDQIQERKAMLDSFIELIASAIDTKSPYTGGHCQRVPVIAELLTQAAAEDKRYFPEFSMDEKKWEALNFAAWLHDCGKVTTPEFVVDKATKLETIYDRIHEVRMRFELLKAQEEIRTLKAIASGGDKETLLKELAGIHSGLDDDFAFVASCNLGHKVITEECNQKLLEIASKTWVRTIDDQQGISWVELERSGPARATPCEEPLLSDRNAHFIPWEEGFNPQESWNESFNLTPGNLRYNRGELHNLTVRQGTLTDEERFMINDHIIQTITMLKRLPYPEHLTNVPDIAGNHHERMDGKGYPRGLKGEDLSVPERVMAIADIFEALTSSDRPYKKTHTIDEAISIMTHMATTGHIDPKLYLLFLEKTIDKVYGQDFLNEEQRISIDRAEHVRMVKAYLGDSF